MNTNLNQALSIIESWQIPPVGCRAAAPVPRWLVDLWVSDRVRFNGFGGLNIVRDDREIVLYAEDWIHVMSDGSIQSCPTDAAL